MIANKSIKDLKRDDIENFIRFCQKPPKSSIGIKKAPRFIEKEGKRKPNTEWRSFVVTISKAAYRKGVNADIDNFELSQGTIKESFAILSTFYNYMLQEEHFFMNPVALIRQKSKFIRKQQNQTQIRRLSPLQWEYVIVTAMQMADHDSDKHERTLFIMSALYSMYLKISELSASERWIPQMKHFYRDNDGNWWFKTFGKGNKERNIAVSKNMLNALKRYRKHLGLSTLPSASDTPNTILLEKENLSLQGGLFVFGILQYENAFSC
jgi:site-specific recombinase XerD